MQLFTLQLSEHLTKGQAESIVNLIHNALNHTASQLEAAIDISILCEQKEQSDGD